MVDIGADAPPTAHRVGVLIYAMGGPSNPGYHYALVRDRTSRWTLPKIEVMPGEELASVALRVAKKTVRIDDEATRLLGRTEWVAFFLMKGHWPGRLSITEEYPEAKWFALADILDLEFHDDELPIITAAIELLLEDERKGAAKGEGGNRREPATAIADSERKIAAPASSNERPAETRPPGVEATVRPAVAGSRPKTPVKKRGWRIWIVAGILSVFAFLVASWTGDHSAMHAPACGAKVLTFESAGDLAMTAGRRRFSDALCAFSIGSIGFEPIVFTAPKGYIINSDKIRADLGKYTGASTTPAFRMDRRALLSEFYFLLRNEVPGVVFSNGSKTRGFVTWSLAEDTMLTAIWEAREPTTASAIGNTLILRVHTGEELSFLAMSYLKLLAFAPLLALLLPGALLLYSGAVQRGLDTFMPSNTPPGLVLFLLLYPAAILASAALTVYVLGYSGASILYVALSVAAVILQFLRDAFAKRLPLVPYFAQPPRVFQKVNLSKNVLTVEEVPVNTSYDADATVWRPYVQACKKCALQYVVHTVGTANTSLGAGEYERREIPDEKYRPMLMSAFEAARPPVNPCPRCGSVEHVRAARLAMRKQRSLRANVILLGLAGLVALAALIVLDYLYGEKLTVSIPVVGWVIDKIHELVVGTGADIASLLVAVFIGSAAIAISGLYLLRGNKCFRIWACGSEGFILEDVKLTVHDRACPSCAQPTTPLRRFVVSRV